MSVHFSFPSSLQYSLSITNLPPSPQGERSRMGEDDLASRALIKLLAGCISVDISAFPLPLISTAPTAEDGGAAHSGAVDVLHEASTMAVDPIEELLAGRVPCIEFGPGGRVVVGAPRTHKVCGASDCRGKWGALRYRWGSVNKEGWCRAHSLLVQGLV